MGTRSSSCIRKSFCTKRRSPGTRRRFTCSRQRSCSFLYVREIFLYKNQKISFLCKERIFYLYKKNLLVHEGDLVPIQEDNLLVRVGRRSTSIRRSSTCTRSFYSCTRSRSSPCTRLAYSSWSSSRIRRSLSQKHCDNNNTLATVPRWHCHDNIIIVTLSW